MKYLMELQKEQDPQEGYKKLTVNSRHGVRYLAVQPKTSCKDCLGRGSIAIDGQAAICNCITRRIDKWLNSAGRYRITWQ